MVEGASKELKIPKDDGVGEVRSKFTGYRRVDYKKDDLGSIRARDQ